MDYSEIRFSPIRKFKGPCFIDCAEQILLFWRRHVESASWFCQEKECVVTVVLDATFLTKGFHLVAIGSVNQVLFKPREILRPAIALSGVRTVVIHNHPSGDPLPSDSDVTVTKRLALASNIVGIFLQDHVIIGDDRYYSFLESDAPVLGR